MAGDFVYLRDSAGTAPHWVGGVKQTDLIVRDDTFGRLGKFEYLDVAERAAARSNREHATGAAIL